MNRIILFYRIRNIYGWIKSTGWRFAWLWTYYRIRNLLGFRSPLVAWIKPRRALHPLLVRLGNSSDQDVFKQIFEFEEYAPLRCLKSPRLIMDLGANVGYSSAYFLSCYPNARVIAIEADVRNIEHCRQNLSSYGDRARVVFGAIWSKRGRPMIAKTTDDPREWATQVCEATANQGKAMVESWDIPSLLAVAEAKEIDLLKVDIEGSERELFGAGSSAWLPIVKNICIELHGAACREVFLRALSEYDYEVSQFGEVTICLNLKRKSGER